jgi:hypothetical protein
VSLLAVWGKTFHPEARLQSTMSVRMKNTYVLEKQEGSETGVEWGRREKAMNSLLVNSMFIFKYFADFKEDISSVQQRCHYIKVIIVKSPYLV